jgi:hypothetical protein
MTTLKKQTETYVLSDLDRLDLVTAYVTNYAAGEGKIVIECYGRSWAAYWGGMTGLTLQKFLLTCNNDYILGKLLEETEQTDFDKINEIAERRGFSFHIDSDVQVAMHADEMAECFGGDWFMDLPRCTTSEYEYVGRILDAIKSAFSAELVNTIGEL